MNVMEWFFGFHSPSLRNLKGDLSYRLWFGHCEAWGYTSDDTWIFLDPQASGLKMRVMHRHDDVLANLEARHLICKTIIRIPATDPSFRFPLHGPITCASLCGNLVGIRALLPSGLRQKLLRNGGQIIHEAERRSSRQGRAPA